MHKIPYMVSSLKLLEFDHRGKKKEIENQSMNLCRAPHSPSPWGVCLLPLHLSPGVIFISPVYKKKKKIPDKISLDPSRASCSCVQADILD